MAARETVADERARLALGETPPLSSAARVTGIVLAGGRSTRFGGDKLAAEIGGRPLLHLAIEAVAGVVDEVVVVVAPGCRHRRCLPGSGFQSSWRVTPSPAGAPSRGS